MTTGRKPILHGRDHAPGGADPVPGCGCCPDTSPCVDYADRVSGYAGDVPDSLLGYWRLGESASPYADTSGHSYGPANAAQTTTGAGSSTPLGHPAGALPPAQDDGAVEWTVTAQNLVLATGDPPPYRFNLPHANETMSVSAWVYPHASGTTFRGQVIGAWASDFFGPCGWVLSLNWPSRAAVFTRTSAGSPKHTTQVTTSSLPANAWAFLLATFDGPTGVMNIYVNGTLAATTTDPTPPTLPTFNNGCYIGNDTAGGASFYGALDEITVWSVVLTPDQGSALYASGLPCATGAAGQVLTVDGAGGTSWQYPVDVNGAGYDEIVTGAGLTATDNGDHTVTLAASGGSPGGPAGGDLAGTYPNPTIAAGAVTSAKILDGTIADADINASAAIAPTKLSHPGGTTSFLRGDGTWAAPASDPAADTKVWLPLSTTVGGDDVLVYDASHQLIPTLTPL
jgi:hypothetical protein